MALLKLNSGLGNVIYLQFMVNAKSRLFSPRYISMLWIGAQRLGHGTQKTPWASGRSKTMPKPAKASKTTGQRALIIGISDYPAPIAKLPAVAADVREMAKLLRSKDGAFRPAGVTVLIDRQATRQAIRDALAEAFGKSAPDETLFVYLAGHGGVEGDGYYYIAHDTNAGRMPATGVPLAEIRSLFDKTASSRAFLWLDFCHSGGILSRGI